MTTRFGRTAALGLTLLLTAGGCSISNSSGSLSDSSGSLSDSSGSLSESSESSSDSSSGDDDSAYRRDVESVTLAALEAEASTEAFLADLGRTAERYGVADWESLASTYRGVGAGLRRAGLGPEAAAAFGQRVFGARPEANAWLLEGYRS